MTNLTILSKDIRTFNDLYSLNDLHRASGSEDRHRPVRFMRLEQTQALIKEIELSTDSCLASSSQRPDLVFAYKTIKGGRSPGTWVCKELVYAYAMWISAKFHLQVIRAFDQMMMNRQPTHSINQNTALLQNANRAAERAYQLELERQKELLELNEMVAQLERSARVARNKLELAMQSHGKQSSHISHISCMHTMMRLQ